MPTPKRGWLTPDEPTSPTTECRLIFIPDNTEFVGAVNGALLDLTKAYNWEAYGTMSPQDAAAVMYEMWLNYIESSCSARVARGYRVNPNGKVQWTENGGETWTDADNDVWLPTVERTEPTEDERRCAAAANAAAVFHQAYTEIIIVHGEDSDPLFGAALLGSILGLLFLGLLVPATGIAVINTLIAFTLEAFTAGWAALEFLEDDDWTEDYDEYFVCLLYEHSMDVDGVIKFDFEAVKANLYSGEFDAGVSIWNYYVLTVVGEQGLNDAGTTTSVEEWDCSCGGWCYDFNFGIDEQGWSQRGAYSTYYDGAWNGGLYATDDTVNAIQISFASSTLKRVRVYAEVSAGASTGTRGIFFNGSLVYIGDDGDGALLYDWIGTSTGITSIWVNVDSTSYPITDRITRIIVEGEGVNPFGDDNCFG